MMLFRKLFANTSTKFMLPHPQQTFARPPFHFNPSVMLLNSYRFFGAHTGYTQSGYTSQIQQKETPFKTDTPAKSNRNQRGLYHKKTHGQRFQRCFSMKKSIITKKPNVKSRNLHSEVLEQDFKLNISIKARKCIIKAGSLDNYLMNTKPEDIDSKFGLYLRDLIKQKKADPEFAVPYIKGQAKLPRSRKTSVWEYKQIPAIYMPAHAKVSEDHSKYFFKTPQEMSRHEIANLEQMLREIDEPDEFIPDEEMWASEEF
jgi:ribosomal protein L28